MSSTSPKALRSPAQIPSRPLGPVSDGDGLVATRIPLVGGTPAVPGGFAPKAFVGEVVPFSVVAFREGHDLIGVQLRLTSPDGEETLHRLTPFLDGTDRWGAEIAIDLQGRWSFRFEAFSDDFVTWAHAAEVKVAVGVDVPVMAALGAELLTRAAAEKDRPAAQRRRLRDIAAALAGGDAATTTAASTDPELARFFRDRPLTTLRSASAVHTLLVERTAAGVGAWYEFFPRSEGAKRLKDGTVCLLYTSPSPRD